MNGENRAGFFSHGGEGESRTHVFSRIHAPQTTPIVPQSLRAGAESMLSLSTGEV